MEIQSKQNRPAAHRESDAHALSELALVLRMSQRAFTEAANKIGDKEIVELFYELALQQAGWEREVNELFSADQRLTADFSSERLRPLQNVLMRVRKAVYGDVYVVLCELEQVVGDIVDRYERAMTQQASSADRIFPRHYRQLVQGREAITRLRERREPVLPDLNAR